MTPGVLTTKRLDASAARRVTAGAVGHLGPAVRGTASVLWRALGEAGAMGLVTPPPKPRDPSDWKR